MKGENGTPDVNAIIEIRSLGRHICRLTPERAARQGRRHAEVNASYDADVAADADSAMMRELMNYELLFEVTRYFFDVIIIREYLHCWLVLFRTSFQVMLLSANISLFTI